MSFMKQSNWKSRILLIVIGLLIIIIAGIGITGFIAKRTLARDNPPNGRLVDIGAYHLHIHCMGEGSPTVIMEAGLNDFSLTWSRVQNEIANFSRVCVYDRAGLGWSEAGTLPRSNEQIVNELYLLLENAAIEAPYILVGHSFGGIIVRLYTHHHPADVIGIVLVDASHEDMFSREPFFSEATQQAIAQFRTLSVLSQIGLFAMSPEEIPAPDFPNEVRTQYQAILATTEYFEAAVAESSSFEASLSQFQIMEVGTLDIPVIVLSRAQPEALQGMSASASQQFEHVWSQMQDELTSISSNSQQIIASNSGHYIQLSEPALVIDAVQELILSYR